MAERKRILPENAEGQVMKKTKVEPSKIGLATVQQENGVSQLRLTSEARTMLQSLHDDESLIGIMCLAGCIRTGRSTLLNLLLDRRNEDGEEAIILEMLPSTLRGVDPASGQAMCTIVLDLCIADDECRVDQRLSIILLGTLVRLIATSIFVNTIGAPRTNDKVLVTKALLGYCPEMTCPPGQRLTWLMRDADVNESIVENSFQSDAFPRQSCRDMQPPFRGQRQRACLTHREHLDEMDADFRDAIAAFSLDAREQTPALCDLRGETCRGGQLLTLIETNIDTINESLRMLSLTASERDGIRTALLTHALPELVDTIIMPYMFCI